jgi:tripartite-type tricarboxylate transporter receptor subunit TctC
MGARFGALVAVSLIALAMAAREAESASSFYEGKTIRLIVGASAGGGYDTYSRVIARHLGKHIAGNPTLVVENMPGAGTLISANYVYKVAKPDGLMIGHFIGGLILQQLLGKPGIEFDGRRFEYIGVPAQDNTVMGIASASGVTTPEQWMTSKTIIKFGGVGPGSAADDITRLAHATIGLPIQLVSGYKGTAEIRLAFNSGEIGGLSNSWESFKATWPKELESGTLRIILQAVSKRHPDLPNVPLVVDYAKTDEARRLIQVGIHDYAVTARPYVFPPGTPKERVQILRQAFMATMRDPEFLAEASKSKLDINPLPGESLEKTVAGIFQLDARLVAKLKEILK